MQPFIPFTHLIFEFCIVIVRGLYTYKKLLKTKIKWVNGINGWNIYFRCIVSLIGYVSLHYSHF